MAFINTQDFDKVIDAPYIGRAQVEVLKAEERANASGKGYLYLETMIVDAQPQPSGLDGLEMKLRQNLYAPTTDQKDNGKFCAMKIRQVMNCFGLEPDLPLSDFDPADIVGAVGEVSIGMTKVKEGATFPAKNEVLDFYKPAPKVENSGENW